MSTDHVPEVSGDESALVPPAPKPEWPKKLRTLTAGELDRLTIDSEGRFHWDGRLVNYESPKAPAPPPAPAPEIKAVDPFDRVAAEILDRAARDLTDPRAAEAQQAPAVNVNGSAQPEDIRPNPDNVPAVEHTRVAETLAPVPAVAAVAAVDAREVAPSAAAIPLTLSYPARAERLRLSLSFWQSLGVLLVILALTLGAAGIAAQGFVTAQEWGCRVGWSRAYCPPPPPPAPAPPPRAEIPS